VPQQLERRKRRANASLSGYDASLSNVRMPSSWPKHFPTASGHAGARVVRARNVAERFSVGLLLKWRILSAHLNAEEVKCVSVVFEDRRTVADNLMGLRAVGLKRSVSAVAAKIDGLNWIVGGIDLSLNDDRQKRHGIAWQPQIYALVQGDLNTVATGLREKFGSTEPVSRPVQIKRCDGSAEAISYAFKTEFVQQIAYKAELAHRQCWSTRKVSLPPARHVQAMMWMHKQGLQGRLFLHGVRMTRVGNGVGLVQIKKRE
jgi:hypothetical protein